MVLGERGAGGWGLIGCLDGPRANESTTPRNIACEWLLAFAWRRVPLYSYTRLCQATVAMLGDDNRLGDQVDRRRDPGLIENPPTQWCVGYVARQDGYSASVTLVYWKGQDLVQ